MTDAVNILLVEDDLDHAEFVHEAFLSDERVKKIYHVTDGDLALDYLDHQGQYQALDQFPRPDLILLDLRMPRMDGIQVLKKIKRDSNLRTIPTIILSTSAAEQDVNLAYHHHANSYLVKPVGFKQFIHLMQTVCQYWFGVNQRSHN